jgi:probable lipoprotein NlpC
MNPALSLAYSKYVGVPYKDHGRDTRGWDCYGLYAHVLREAKGIVVPSYSFTYSSSEADNEVIRALSNALPTWVRVEPGTEEEGDGIVFNLAGRPLHCGYIIEPGVMLHTLRGRETCIERYDTASWNRRIEGMYKWK